MSDSRREPETGPEQGGVERGGVESGTAGVAEPGAVPASGRPTTWLGRAEVPRREAPEVRYAAPVPDWETGPEQRQYRPWWLPILVGTVALLFGLLSIALWAVAESRRTGPAPALTATGPSSEAPRPEPPAGTTPSAGLPSTLPTGAAAVPMPPLVGLHEVAARELLDELGLTYRLRFRAAPQQPGAVVDTEPKAGTLLRPGDLVTLVIAEEPSGSPGDNGSASQPPTPFAWPAPFG
ncbi:PASTA domain-containing protein [Micromonospora sp. NPDC049559]|uniref:PASTA domain-containing protein n=1 Tax=Micromonospora sp. NPDC049559 TaxID=3155923 RepID=UPI0034429290